MESEGLPPIVVDTFAYCYEQVVAGGTGLIYNRDITCVGPEDIDDLAALSAYAEADRKVYGNTVKIILNGGLGTTMGLTRPNRSLRSNPEKNF